MIQATASDFDLVRSGYLDVIGHTPEIGKLARWSYGRHPTDELLRAYVRNGEMYLWMDRDKLAGMAAVVMRQEENYEAVSWAENLANDRVATIHLLAVCPEFQGMALGSRILESAVDLAKRNGKKALRLDVLESNLPARHMYEKAGFSFRGKQRWYAENTGWANFLLYEKTLD